MVARVRADRSAYPRLLDAPAVREGCLIDPIGFRPADLAATIPEHPVADLAVCHECAEHLPMACGLELIDRLTSDADRVCSQPFLQGKEERGNINLQPPEYRRGLFKHRGFVRYDVLRADLLKQADVGYLYKQKLFIFFGMVCLLLNRVASYCQ